MHFEGQRAVERRRHEAYPSSERISETKVTAFNNNAEFAQFGDVTFTTKSGTNKWHGTPSNIFRMQRSNVMTASQDHITQGLRELYKLDLDPRISLAYRPFSNDKTVIRAGVGIFTLTTLGPMSFNNAGNPTSNLLTNVNSPSGANGGLGIVPAAGRFCARTAAREIPISEALDTTSTSMPSRRRPPARDDLAIAAWASLRGQT